MGLTADIGLRGIMLGIKRVEVLLKPIVGRDAGVDGAADWPARPLLAGRASDAALSRSPRNLGPLQQEAGTAQATLDRLGGVLPFPGNPSASNNTAGRTSS